jgi:hypothetical protein
MGSPWDDSVACLHVVRGARRGGQRGVAPLRLAGHKGCDFDCRPVRLCARARRMSTEHPAGAAARKVT